MSDFSNPRGFWVWDNWEKRRFWFADESRLGAAYWFPAWRDIHGDHYIDPAMATEGVQLYLDLPLVWSVSVETSDRDAPVVSAPLIIRRTRRRATRRPRGRR